MLDPYFDRLRQKGLALRAGAPAPSIPAMRAMMAKETDALGCGPELALVEDHRIATRSGALRMRSVSPRDPKGVIVFVHGGGWALGRIEDFESLARKIAQTTGCSVLLPDYRLAPENPYPAGLEDVMDTLLWAERHAKDRALPLLGMGDSAGANLLLAATLELIDRLCLTHLLALYPVVDCDFQKPSYRAMGEGQLFTAAAMRGFFAAYAAEELWRAPTISVLSHPKLALLPEVTVLTCGCDLLQDDGIALVSALEGLGKVVTHLHYPAAPHAFLRHHKQSDLAAQALAELSEGISAKV